MMRYATSIETHVKSPYHLVTGGPLNVLRKDVRIYHVEPSSVLT